MGSIYKNGEGILTFPGLRGHPPIDHGKGHSDETTLPEGRKIGVDYSEEDRSAQEKEMKGLLLFFPHNPSDPPLLTFVSVILVILKATSKNVIPAKAGIQKPVTLLDSRLRGSDKVIIIRGSLKSCPPPVFLFLPGRGRSLKGLHRPNLFNCDRTRFKCKARVQDLAQFHPVCLSEGLMKPRKGSAPAMGKQNWVGRNIDRLHSR
jgi:hypothetical protein